MGGFKAHLRSLFQYSAQHLCKAYTDSHKLGEFLMILRDNYNKEKLIFIEGSGLEKMTSVIDYFSSKKKKYSSKAKK